MKKKHSIDKVFLGLALTIALLGLFVFTSASFGLFARKGFSLQDLFFDQVALGLFLGLIAMVVAIRFPIDLLRKYSLHLFIASVVLTILVFVPHVGLEKI